MQPHGQPHMNLVAVLPDAREREVALWLCFDRLFLAVDRDFHILLYPIRNADTHGKLPRLLRGYRNYCRVFLRKLRFLPNCQVLLFPVEFGWDKQIHPQRVVVVEVDRLAVL